MPPTKGDDIVAGVLVGGQSRRFHGNKLLLPLTDGLTMVEHVCRVAHHVAGEVVLLGNAPNLPATLLNSRNLPDDHLGSGPAAGLAALLADSPNRWTLLLSCDLPNLDVGTLTRLVRAPRHDVDVLVFAREDNDCRLEPCCALYHSRILPVVRRELAAGRGGLKNVIRRARARVIRLGTRDGTSLADVDTRLDALALGLDVPPTGCQRTERSPP